MIAPPVATIQPPMHHSMVMIQSLIHHPTAMIHSLMHHPPTKAPTTTTTNQLLLKVEMWIMTQPTAVTIQPPMHHYTHTPNTNHHLMVSMHGQQSLLIILHYPTMHLMYFPPYVPPYHPAYSVMGQNANADTQDQNVLSIQQPLSPDLGDHHDEKKEDDNTTINI